MKTIIITLMMSLLASSAYATTSTSFTISTFSNNGSRVYYNCDSVEDRVESILNTMGVSVVDVRCTGGLDRFGRMHTSAFVRTTFDATALEAKEVKITDRSRCHLNNSIVKSLAKSIKVENLKLGTCFRSGSRTRISLNIVK